MMEVFQTGWKRRFGLWHATMQTLRTLEALEREGLVTPDPRLADCLLYTSDAADE